MHSRPPGHPDPLLSRVPSWAALIAVAAASMALARVGLAFSRGPGSFALFWPLSGLMLGVLLLSPPRRWPALVAAAAVPVAVLGVAAGEPAWWVASFAGASALEAPLGAWLTLRLCGGLPDLSRLGHLFRLVAAGPVLACGTASLVPAAVLCRLAGAPFALVVLGVWTGGFLGSLAVAPALLAWSGDTPAPRPSALRLAEMAGVLVAIAAVAWILYGPGKQFRFPASLFLPLLLWAALRFGMRGTALATALVCMLVLWFTVLGMGRFAESVAPSVGVISAQLYCAINLLSMLAMSSVIESRRLGAEALRHKERQLRLVRRVTDAASDPLTCLDPTGTIVYANDALCSVLRRPRGAILGQPVWSVVPIVSPAIWQRHWERVKKEGTVTDELPATEIERHPVPFEIRSSYLSFDGQEFCVSGARDLRDRRKAEAALRLASIGTMAAGMAHEINNPLAYVIGNLEWIVQQVQAARAAGGAPDAGGPTRDALAAIEPALAETAEGAGRIRDVVRDLKLFSRSGDGAGSPDPADVVRALRAAVTLAQHEIRHRAQLVQEYEQLPPVTGDEHRLGQVFLNLILNAAQAIPEGHLADNLVRVAARRVDGEVLVEVEDTGCGMSGDVLARIFDPFFTTKPVGFGTGLGLSICHGIISSAGGRIEVSSRPARGSLFRVRLPLAREQAGQAGARPPASGGARAGCRVLVVDDDPSICRVLQRVLPDHDVLGCTSAAAALDRAASEPFDVVVCDLMMPEMTGMEFHERLARSRPGLASRTIFVTGGAFTPAAREFLERTANLHLEKPFETSALRAAIERAVERGREQPGAGG